MLLEQGIGLADGYSSRRSIQKPEVVILVPTRELAIQIYQQVRKFAHGSTLKAALVYGGASMEQQVSNLMDQRRCNILVATPGRLLHFLQLKTVDFSDLQVFIMDEADRMLDIGFSNELESIRNLSTMPPRVLFVNFPSKIWINFKIIKRMSMFMNDWLFTNVPF